MKRLIAQVKFSDDLHNKLTLNVYINTDLGSVSYSLVDPKTRMAHSLSNLQCGWRSNDLLPDNIFEYNTNQKIFDGVLLAIKGSVYSRRVTSSNLF